MSTLKVELEPQECAAVISGLHLLNLSMLRAPDANALRVIEVVEKLSKKIQTEIIEQKLLDGTKCPIKFGQ